jgi:subtilisin-like proprotein convertase family protein
LTHGNPDDLEMLLVGPNGANLVLLSDVGGSADANGVTLTFDDTAASKVPDSGPVVTGTFKPTSVNSTAESFPAPAPPGPHDHPSPAGAATLQSAFNGTSPNGTWSLYVVDDVSGIGGTIAGGWGLTFTMSTDAATVTTLASSQNPSTLGNPVIFTATVKSGGTAVTNGTVSFLEGQSTLAGPLALNGSGQVLFNTSALTEGSHVITAQYNGSPGAFNISDTNRTQVVDGITTVSGSQFCNAGTISLPASGSPGMANAYPSHINVSGLPTNLSKITVTLNGITHPTAEDLEVLLVGPQGQQLVLLSDAGGDNALNNVTVTFDDLVDSSLPDSTPFGSGTFRPTSYNSTPANFPSPAPAGPYSHAAPAGVNTLTSKFAGTNPNGTWSLYVVDDVSSGAGGTIAGWCMTLTSPASQYFVSVRLTNGLPRVSFVGSPGTSYYFQRALVVSGPWTNVTSALLAPPGGLLEFQDTNAAVMPIRFYRTKVGP